MKITTYRGIALALWCLLFVKAVRATTLAEFMGPYEPDLKYWALVFALTGGFWKSVLSWQDDARAAKEIARSSFWNLLNSAVAGMAAFFVVQALRSIGWAIPHEIRVGCILLAGWGGKASLDFIVEFCKARIAAFGFKQDSKPVEPTKETQ